MSINMRRHIKKTKCEVCLRLSFDDVIVLKLSNVVHEDMSRKQSLEIFVQPNVFK